MPSAVMFNLYTKFLMDAIVSKGKTQNSERFSTSEHTVGCLSCLLTVYEKAENMGCLTEDHACQHVSLYLQLGNLDEARNLAEKFCSGKFSGAVCLWLLRVSVEMKYVTRKCPSPSKADLLSIFELLRNVLTKVAVSEAEDLWLMVCNPYSHFILKYRQTGHFVIVSILVFGIYPL